MAQKVTGYIKLQIGAGKATHFNSGGEFRAKRKRIGTEKTDCC